MAKRKRFKASQCAKLREKFNGAVTLKKTKLFDTSVGVKFDAPATIQHTKVDGQIVIKQSMKGKQKQYRTSKPLI